MAPSSQSVEPPQNLRRLRSITAMAYLTRGYGGVYPESYPLSKPAIATFAGDF